jgi:hypothetical protein
MQGSGCVGDNNNLLVGRVMRQMIRAKTPNLGDIMGF